MIRNIMLSQSKIFQKNSQNLIINYQQLQNSLSPLPGTLRILAVTWNIVGSIPLQKYLLKFFSSKQFQEKPDIIFIGTQECERSLFWSFFCQSKSGWQNQLNRYLYSYDLFATNTLQGLHSAVLVHNIHKWNTFLINKQKLKAGFIFNLFGNKGAVSIKIKIYGQYLQFINCHLAPHQDNNQHRNKTLIRILQNLVCKRHQTEVILLGDMNYRIELKNKEYQIFLKTIIKNTEEEVQYSKMMELQQLRNQQLLKVKFFPYFQQQQITFPPTYKMNLQDDFYNKKRVPGWTDRIFHRKGKLIRKRYDCLYDVYGSDHRPVLSLFQLDIQEGISIFQGEQFNGSSCQII